MKSKIHWHSFQIQWIMIYIQNDTYVWIYVLVESEVSLDEGLLLIKTGIQEVEDTLWTFFKRGNSMGMNCLQGLYIYRHQMLTHS